jgi:hypothetical protein
MFCFIFQLRQIFRNNRELTWQMKWQNNKGWFIVVKKRWTKSGGCTQRDDPAG